MADAADCRASDPTYLGAIHMIRFDLSTVSLWMVQCTVVGMVGEVGESATYSCNEGAIFLIQGFIGRLFGDEDLI